MPDLYFNSYLALDELCLDLFFFFLPKATRWQVCNILFMFCRFALNWSHCEGCTARFSGKKHGTSAGFGWGRKKKRRRQNQHVLFVLNCLFADTMAACPHGVGGDAEEPAVCTETTTPSWKDSADKGAADLFISFAARDTDREDVSPVSEAQPTHQALVSFGLFGRNARVLPRPTFSF